MNSEPTYNLLNSINYPEDLRKLTVEQLPEVCGELRQDIIKELCCNPGHFAASLGTVELTVALHYVYNTPYDRIVWDVGHQAYGHKILTGRREAFSTNRKLGGIRPFPSPEESEYDTFTCGHASNSISAALGMAVAAARKGDAKRHVVAIIGDGSMSGGLAFEGLNNASATSNNLLIILNDNDMAIDRSVGGMKQYLFNLTTSNRYNQLRFKLSRMLFKLGILNEERRKALIRFGNSLKSMAAQQQNIFEGMNIRYFGPIDGHDVKNLARVLRDIKDMQGPKILHLHTIKGKGFGPAEKHATEWHAPGKFDPVTGERFIANTEGMPPLFQDVFGNTLVELAEANPKIVGVTPAMPSGCSMNILMEKMPKRAFDVGIAEEHAVTFAAGLASAGMKPYFAVYSSFLQRGFDQIIHDVAIGGFPVRLLIDRAGIVGEDGETHQGLFDVAFLTGVPGMTIYSPTYYDELERDIELSAERDEIVAVRYPRGCEKSGAPKEITGDYTVFEGVGDKAIVTYGRIFQNAIEAQKALPDITVIKLNKIYPISDSLINDIGKYKELHFFEEGIKNGGVAELCAAKLLENGYKGQYNIHAVDNKFVPTAAVSAALKSVGLDTDSMINALKGAYE